MRAILSVLNYTVHIKTNVFSFSSRRSHFISKAEFSLLDNVYKGEVQQRGFDRKSPFTLWLWKKHLKSLRKTIAIKINECFSTGAVLWRGGEKTSASMFGVLKKKPQKQPSPFKWIGRASKVLEKLIKSSTKGHKSAWWFMGSFQAPQCERALKLHRYLGWQ